MNAENPAPPSRKLWTRFDWRDPFGLDAQLSEEQRMVAEAQQVAVL